MLQTFRPLATTINSHINMLHRIRLNYGDGTPTEVYLMIVFSLIIQFTWNTLYIRTFLLKEPGSLMLKMTAHLLLLPSTLNTIA